MWFVVQGETSRNCSTATGYGSQLFDKASVWIYLALYSLGKQPFFLPIRRFSELLRHNHHMSTSHGGRVPRADHTQSPGRTAAAAFNAFGGATLRRCDASNETTGSTARF